VHLELALDDRCEAVAAERIAPMVSTERLEFVEHGCDIQSLLGEDPALELRVVDDLDDPPVGQHPGKRSEVADSQRVDDPGSRPGSDLHQVQRREVERDLDVESNDVLPGQELDQPLETGGRIHPRDRILRPKGACDRCEDDLGRHLRKDVGATLAQTGPWPNAPAVVWTTKRR
jgi:hypothetical protein